MTLPETAENFQSLGYNVLLYDARSVGASDGEPRNQLSPYQMAEDVSGEPADTNSYCLTFLTHSSWQTS